MSSTQPRTPAVSRPGLRKPASRRSAAVRRAEIADAAEAIARAEGLSAVTMRAVAARAEVTPTLVVHHVDSMDQLVADAFTRVVAAELTEVVALASAVNDAGARLDAVLDTVLDGARDEVTLVWVEAWALGRRNALLAAAVREQMDAWRAFFAALIQAGCAAGRYRVADPLAVAGQLLGMLDGLNAHSLVGWEGGVDRRSLMRRAAGAMLGVAESR
ncbi:MAG: TetR family transcriptional regulator C-terminal domain-containing protein [Actinobacteria bacterium]|nr:TetR family transcriptional regulator C-terminal domain-containing protein [Actinomycetota bacterium]